jgi:uncharacterized protein
MSNTEKLNECSSSFIADNKIASICCAGSRNKPWCFHCYYVFDEKNQLLFFKSSARTRHAALLSENHAIAGGILSQKSEFLALKGIQFTGTVLYTAIPGQIDAGLFYHKRLPLGLTKPGAVYCIQLESIKMTDNSRMFGKKLEWNRHAVLDERVK